jgi:hypothetical protein
MIMLMYVAESVSMCKLFVWGVYMCKYIFKHVYVYEWICEHVKSNLLKRLSDYVSASMCLGKCVNDFHACEHILVCE